MCTQTETTKDRDLMTLLKLETYQGMSDSEIESIIEYKAKIMLREYATSAKMQESIEKVNAIYDGFAQHKQTMRDMLESIRKDNQCDCKEVCNGETGRKESQSATT